MRGQSFVGCLAATILLAGCEAPITESGEPAAAPDGILRSCSPTYGCPPDEDGGGGGTTTPADPELSFLFSGTPKVMSAGNAVYRARASGGVAPYYFYWLFEACYSTAVCSDPRVFAEGWGRDSAAVYLTADMAAVHVTVQIRDGGSPQLTTGETMTTLGPLAFVGPVSSKFCGGTPNMFPFVATRLDSSGREVGAGPNGERYYVRYGCGGGRIWSHERFGFPHPYP